VFAGGIVAANGIDNVQSGIRQAISGKTVQTVTSAAVEKITGSRFAGEGTNIAIGLAGPGTVAKMATGKGLIASFKSVISDALHSIKNVGSNIKNWWKGTPKTVTTNITPDIQTTLDRIKAGIKFPHKHDGTVFKNREGLLPVRPEGYYREYVHPIPGVSGAGVQRIILGENGEIWYSPDHYRTFIRLFKSN
jgi:guanyl-specific ribonuclease Sa